MLLAQAQEAGVLLNDKQQDFLDNSLEETDDYKMLLAQAQEAGVLLNDKQQDFLDNSLEETDDCKDLQLQATTNFKVNHVDAYGSDCDDKATTNAIFMANLSPVGSINDDMVKPRYDFNILSKTYISLRPNLEVLQITIKSQDTVMSNSEDFIVTYTKVSSQFEDLSDTRSTRVYGVSMMPDDPYAYVEATLQAPPSPNYMPGPEEP
uniref:Uncharacterized protein n=1 Tax=Tanacetum cinerariifolium TaxID=118510 RepID=A0A6L2LGH1_TANCI|nr:hypothetical protein [Tanacetum cinerariifolium]